MKHNLTLLFLCSFACIQAQTKVILNQELSPGSSIFVEAQMSQTTSTISLTMQGPSDRWFGVGFGIAMIGGDALIYTDGRQGAMHALGAWDYDLNAQQTSGVDKDNTQNWTLVSNTVNGGLRTITATRLLNNGDPIDDVLSFTDANLNLIWAKGSVPGNTMSYHGANRGVISIPWALPDTTAPQLANPAFLPLDDQLDVTLSTNLTVFFDENVIPGTGNIELYETSGNNLIEAFDVLTAISINGNTVTINPSANLASNTSYHVLIPPGSIKDPSGNDFAGILNSTTWNFTTIDLSSDTIPPSLIAGTLFPSDNATSVPVTTGFNCTFNEDVTPLSGSIELRKSSDNSLVESFDVNGGSVTQSGNTLSFTPSSPLSFLTNYYILIPAATYSDIAGNAFDGVLSDTLWNFTTDFDVNDSIPPTLAVTPFDPADNTLDVLVNTDLTVTFNENIFPGSGMIQLRNASTNALIQMFDPSGADVSIIGNQLIMNPTSDLSLQSSYYIVIQQGAVTDLGGNPYAGYTNSFTWNFSTASIIGLSENQSNENMRIWWDGNGSIWMKGLECQNASYDIYASSGMKIATGQVEEGGIIPYVAEEYQLITLGITCSDGRYVRAKIPLFPK
jgi:hypothetical protein